MGGRTHVPILLVKGMTFLDKLLVGLSLRDKMTRILTGELV